MNRADRKNIDMAGALRPRRRISCGDMPNEGGCTVTIAGTEEEVVELAALHAIHAHGYPDTPELRDHVREMLRDELV
jgi:predicted small metal-binding protein